ncbi:MAG: electron transfer flavoprotein subunit beta/FixA family protein [Steroidobacteraceae bacterium]
MKRLLVAVKRVIDYNVRIRLKPDGSGIISDGVKLSLNPFDEIALEEALRMRERGQVDEVVVATIAPADAQTQLRTALAMGADRALHVEYDGELEPLDVAHLLLKLVEREQPAGVLLGKQAIDGDHNQTGQMLAALWGRPQATFASRITLEGAQALVEREIDAGLETIEVALPAVFTSDLRLNEPRYVKLPDIIKAKKKPLQALSVTELGYQPRARLRTVKYEAPPVRARGRKVASAAELVSELAARNLLP